MDETGASGQIRLPGLGLPINWGHKNDPNRPKKQFPSAVEGFVDGGLVLTSNELMMISLMEELTNKPEWNRKVHDEEIVAMWKVEAMAVDQTAQGIEGGQFTEELFDYCIKELRDKAKLLESTGLVVVMDGDCPAVKSDTAIPPELNQALRKAVAPLENVPEQDRDWHPRSNKRVLDIVHPSLWPLVYGRSRALTDRLISLESCLENCGAGDVVEPVLEKDQRPLRDADHGPLATHGPNAWYWGEEFHWREVDTILSTRFQWLPCNVEVSDAGKTAKITSYINNLHPKQNAELYGVIEQLIAKSIPLWQLVWKGVMERDTLAPHRIVCTQIDYEYKPPEGQSEDEKDCWGDIVEMERPLNPGETEDTRDEWLDEEWHELTHPAVQPGPTSYSPPKLTYAPGDEVQDGGLLDFAAGKLQVIVKLANIHLTPEDPEYPGGSWHIEGQHNERICATAIYYYDSHNITDSYLAFRQPVEPTAFSLQLNYEQFVHYGIEAVFGVQNGQDAIQNRGRVLTREGRLLAFPNVLQHQVSPFRLADLTKPGHRKIVALFLVDPARRIISTANVPPQRQDWWREQMTPYGRLGPLPPEITDMVVDSLDSVIGLDEARKLREELMAERTRRTKDTHFGDHYNRTWDFCEH